MVLGDVGICFCTVLQIKHYCSSYQARPLPVAKLPIFFFQSYVLRFIAFANVFRISTISHSTFDSVFMINYLITLRFCFSGDLTRTATNLRSPNRVRGQPDY